jgi:hypothetical protein
MRWCCGGGVVTGYGTRGQFAPVRGTARAVLLVLRRGDWTAGVAALGRQVGAEPRMVWSAVLRLVERDLIGYRAPKVGDLRIYVTGTGRMIRL